MLFVLLSKRFLHMTVLDGFAFVAIHANLLDRYRFQYRYRKRTAGAAEQIHSARIAGW